MGMRMGAALGALGLLLCAGSAEARKPNVVYIMADDLGYGDLGSYGQKIIKTPNLDRLAVEGMRFTDHYSGSTVCAPSRCVLMTGRHTGHCPIKSNGETNRETWPMGHMGAAGQLPLPASEVTLAAMMKKAGYATGCIGKWGLGSRHSTGDPNTVGFDHFFGYYDQRDAHYYYIDFLWRNGEPVELKDNVKLQNQYTPDLLVKEALGFIRDNKDKPFFLYLPFVTPHAELAVPEESMADYAGIKERKPWPNKKFPYRVERKSYGLYNYCEKPHQVFAAMVTRLDRDIGRVMALLKELGLDNDTVVFFTSDNGPHYEGGADPNFFDSNGPLHGFKRDLYDGGVRVPLIVRQPGKIKPGSVSGHVSAFWDVMPTVCEIAGVKAPANTDGISMAPTLFGGEQAKHAYLFWDFRGWKALRKGDWKLHLKGNNRVELYNLKTDLGERKNLATERPEMVAELRELVKDAMQ
jgi:arylsulfatase A